MDVTRDGAALPDVNPRGPIKDRVRLCTAAAMAASIYAAGTRTAVASGYATTVATGTTPPTVSLAGTPTINGTIILQITTPGARGVAVFKWSSDGGATYTTGVLTAATTLLGSTGVTATWGAGAGPAYANNNVYTTAPDFVAMATIDGVTPVVGNRFIDKDHATATRRGWYDVLDLGSTTTQWVIRRSSDADTSDKIVPGVITEITEGTANGDSLATLTTNGTAGVIVLDTDSLAFALGSGSGASAAYVDAADALRALITGSPGMVVGDGTDAPTYKGGTVVTHTDKGTGFTTAVGVTAYDLTADTLAIVLNDALPVGTQFEFWAITGSVNPGHTITTSTSQNIIANGIPAAASFAWPSGALSLVIRKRSATLWVVA